MYLCALRGRQFIGISVLSVVQAQFEKAILSKPAIVSGTLVMSTIFGYITILIISQTYATTTTIVDSPAPKCLDTDL